MAHKTKAARAAYMRRWRERQAAGADGSGEAQAPRIVEDNLDQGAASPLPSAPAFLAAPVDECPMCHHDRQEADHLGGRPCKFKTSPRRNCGCMFEGF